MLRLRRPQQRNLLQHFSPEQTDGNRPGRVYEKATPTASRQTAGLAPTPSLPGIACARERRQGLLKDLLWVFSALVIADRRGA